jgi:hypothetical protein
MTDTREAPIAYRMFTWKASTSSGTMTTPPPKPVSAPVNPAARLPRQSRRLNVRIVTLVNLNNPTNETRLPPYLPNRHHAVARPHAHSAAAPMAT